MSKRRTTEEIIDEAVTRTAAMVLANIRAALKAAIKEALHEFWTDMVVWFLKDRWVRIILGLLSLAGLLGFWWKEHT